eukprot:364500-Chlamydomonas_euryale.AAC.7
MQPPIPPDTTQKRSCPSHLSPAAAAALPPQAPSRSAMTPATQCSAQPLWATSGTASSRVPTSTSR